MSCYHPNIIILEKNGAIKKDGSLGYKTKYIPFNSENYNEWMENGKLIKGETYGNTKIKLVPCRMCQGCKSDRRKEWATRLELETKTAKGKNYFVTFTYNDENILIPKWWIIKETGEKLENPNNERGWTGTLVKKDAEKLVKHIKQRFKRKYNWTGMKYYLCGEYGDKGGRCHLHAILINCPDIPLYVDTERKGKEHAYYRSEDLEHVWNKGFVTVGKVSWDSISYVAGYVNKKKYGKKALYQYEIQGKIPEFALMSNKIGYDYWSAEWQHIYKNDEIINTKGKSIKPPAYFDRLLAKESPETLERIKNKRENITENETMKKISKYQGDYSQVLKNEEIASLEKQKIYNRDRIK